MIDEDESIQWLAKARRQEVSKHDTTAPQVSVSRVAVKEPKNKIGEIVNVYSTLFKELLKFIISTEIKDEMTDDDKKTMSSVLTSMNERSRVVLRPTMFRLQGFFEELGRRDIFSKLNLIVSSPEDLFGYEQDIQRGRVGNQTIFAGILQLNMTHAGLKIGEKIYMYPSSVLMTGSQNPLIREKQSDVSICVQLKKILPANVLNVRASTAYICSQHKNNNHLPFVDQTKESSEYCMACFNSICSKIENAKDDIPTNNSIVQTMMRIPRVPVLSPEIVLS